MRHHLCQTWVSQVLSHHGPRAWTSRRAELRQTYKSTSLRCTDFVPPHKGMVVVEKGGGGRDGLVLWAQGAAGRGARALSERRMKGKSGQLGRRGWRQEEYLGVADRALSSERQGWLCQVVRDPDAGVWRGKRWGGWSSGVEDAPS